MLHLITLEIIDYFFLNQSFEIRGVALKWFESYLEDRTQTVQFGSCISTPVTLK